MEQSPSWEANRFSASQEIPHILWNPNVQYVIHKCPPPVPKPARSSPCPKIQLAKIHLNIILPSITGSYKWSLSRRFPPLCSPPYVLHAPPISFFSHHVLHYRFIEQLPCTTYTVFLHTRVSSCSYMFRCLLTLSSGSFSPTAVPSQHIKF